MSSNPNSASGQEQVRHKRINPVDNSAMELVELDVSEVQSAADAVLEDIAALLDQTLQYRLEPRSICGCGG